MRQSTCYEFLPMDKQLTIENKPKRKKTGGKTRYGMEKFDTAIGVPSTDKQLITEFRDYLNQPITRDIAVSMLNELERMARIN
jgi:hypothetical protein